MKKKKILVFGLSNRVGGVETFYFSYYNELDKNKYQIDFAVKYDTVFNEDEVKKNGAKIFSIPKLYKNPLKHYRILNKIYKEGKYDIVHSNIVSAANIVHLKLAKKYKVKKIIIHSHNSGISARFIFRIFHILNKSKLRKLGTHYLACTQMAGEWLFGKEANFTVLNNALDINKFKYNFDDREEIRNELNINDDFVLGHIGRMCHQKNQEFLIEVFKEYSKINEKAKLIMIGCGCDEPKIRNLIDKYNLNEKVFIIQSDNPYKYYSAFDMFIFPSRYEGLGIVGIEAQINGLPCLFSDKIPTDIKVNDNIKFLSIDDVNEWIEVLKSNKLKRTKKLNSSISRYDIKKEKVKLEKLYQGE